MTNTEHEITGYRFIARDYSKAPKVGDTLDRSYIWDGAEITETQLDGTCCFETRDQIENYAKYSKGKGWIVEVGGNYAGRGDDFVGEILIDRAIVLSVTSW